MDWSNERYVRLYTRDSVTWSLWPWEARALFCFLLRKVDRAGVLDLGGNDPVRAVAAVVGMPLAMVKEHLPAIIESGAVEVGATAMVMPNYIEAQEAKSSDKQRQSESRGRRRDRARAGADVTKRDTSSRPVTRSHDASQDVTPSLAEPSRTEPSCTERESPAKPETRGKKPPSPIGLELAQYLYDAIRSHKPDFLSGKSPAFIEKKLNGWAWHLDKLTNPENDGRDPNEVKRVIDYCHRSAEEFERPNVQSGAKLRKRWEQLSTKARRGAPARGQAVPKAPKMDYQAASEFWRTQ